MGSLMLGRVSCDMHRCATYARINVPAWDGGPHLSIKATITGFTKNQFTKGTVVEVERNPVDGRRFRVTTVFQDADEECPWGDVCEPDDKIVRFWLGRRYFDDVEMGNRMRDVLRDALGFNNIEANRATTEKGCWVTCRESQFARFLIERNMRCLPNLFQELRVEYHSKPKPSPEIDVSDR